MKNKGFTFIELIIIIAIFITLASTTLIAMASFLNNTYLEDTSSQFVQSIRKAQSNSILRLENSKWGVYIDNDADPSFTFFKGNNYEGRDTDFDETYDLPEIISFEEVSITGGNEIIFNKVNGETNNHGFLKIKENNQNYKTITINSLGQIDVEKN